MPPIEVMRTRFCPAPYASSCSHIAPDAAPAARTVARAAYRPAQESESAQQYARRVSAATATWCSITPATLNQLASAHHAGSAA